MLTIQTTALLSQYSEKSPGDLKRLDLTQTSLRDQQLTQAGKTYSNNNNNNNNNNTVITTIIMILLKKGEE